MRGDLLQPIFIVLHGVVLVVLVVLVVCSMSSTWCSHSSTARIPRVGFICSVCLLVVVGSDGGVCCDGMAHCALVDALVM
jgi:hypothetical protein